jgi:hypothetical protein
MGKESPNASMCKSGRREDAHSNEVVRARGHHEVRKACTNKCQTRRADSPLPQTLRWPTPPLSATQHQPRLVVVGRESRHDSIFGAFAKKRSSGSCGSVKQA